MAELEKDFDVTIITQNIDDLHERAGSTRIIHLHGEIFKMRSEKNIRLVYDIKGDINFGDFAEDGSQLRPFIVWFEEPVPKLKKQSRWWSNADIFVVVGTSLAVYPAAGLVNFTAPGIPLYIIDKRIPDNSFVNNLITIEKPATEGDRSFYKINIFQNQLYCYEKDHSIFTSWHLVLLIMLGLLIVFMLNPEVVYAKKHSYKQFNIYSSRSALLAMTK